MPFAFAHTGPLRLLLTIVSLCLLSIYTPAQTFTSTSYSAATPSAGSLARADMNNDGFPDLVNAGGPDVFVILNNGDGTFRAPLQFNAGGGDVLKVTIADVNGDGHADVIAAHGSSSGTSQIAILLGNGDGTLKSPTQLPETFTNFKGFDLADFNRDGRQDLLVGFVEGSTVNRMTVLFGDGASFGNPREFTGFGKVPEPGENAYNFVSLAAGDYNGDGKPDIAIGEFGGGFDVVSGSISVFYGNGDGTFGSEIFEGSPSGVFYIQTVNGNNDGIADLAYLYSGCHTPCVGAGIAMGDASGLGHKSIQQLPFDDNVNGVPRAVELADVTGDGRPDGILAAERMRSDGTIGPAILVSEQQSDGSFKPVKEYDLPDFAADLQSGDFNRDGKWDFASSNSDAANVTVFSNTTTGIGCAYPGANRAINVCTPAANSTVTSPVLFRFNARTTTEITGMRIYVDGTSKFLSQGQELTARLIITPGTHSITVKAWDAAGPFSKSFTLTVSGDAGPCQPSSTARTFTICTPNPNDWQPTGVRLTANANGTHVRATQVYIDGSLKYQTPNFAVDTQLTLNPGKRQITVKGWDDLGSFSKTIFVWVYGGVCKPNVAPGGRGLTVCQPKAGTTYNSSAGVPIQVVAVSPNTITSFTEQWENSTPRQFAPQTWINERSFPPVGNNTWRFVATDSQGTMSQTVTVLVANSNCPAPSTRTTVFCSPTNGQTVNGVFTLSASAGNPSGTFKALQIYKDGAVWFQTNSPFFSIATGLPAGTHRLTAKAWDSAGAYSTTINVTSTGN
jgi:hypothetical protein